MYYDILDKKRKGILPLFNSFKDRFYLAGGTALALQIGHRDSVDFDFFSPESFDTADLFKKCESVFAGHELKKIQDEENTLTILVDGSALVSFLSYPYKLVEPLIETEHMRLASVVDIGCMKLSAITGRSTFKDYVDIYFILKSISIRELLGKAVVKFPTLDATLILKSLAYFEDISPEPIRFTSGRGVSLDEIKVFLQKEVRGVFKGGKGKNNV